MPEAPSGLRVQNCRLRPFHKQLIKTKAIPASAIYICDETAIWLNATSNTTVCEAGAKEVSIRTTGHDKVRLTVLLCAKADGFKPKPYILLPRKRVMPELVNKYGHKVILKFEGTTWMIQALCVNRGFSSVGPRRLAFWTKATFGVGQLRVPHQ